MKTDRELLELAAKACIRSGMRLECPDDDDGIYVCRDQSRNGHTWNPLTDDGDALRLAVNLSLDVDQEKQGPEVWIDRLEKFIFEPCGSDRLAATRRAIVRAAAAIGESIP